MNENLDMYEVEVGQSSKGIWYCKSLKVYNSKILVINQELDELIGQIDTTLDKHNEKVPPRLQQLLPRE